MFMLLIVIDPASSVVANKKPNPNNKLLTELLTMFIYIINKQSTRSQFFLFLEPKNLNEPRQNSLLQFPTVEDN